MRLVRTVTFPDAALLPGSNPADRFIPSRGRVEDRVVAVAGRWEEKPRNPLLESEILLDPAAAGSFEVQTVCAGTLRKVAA